MAVDFKSLQLTNIYVLGLQLSVSCSSHSSGPGGIDPEVHFLAVPDVTLLLCLKSASHGEQLLVPIFPPFSPVGTNFAAIPSWGEITGSGVYVCIFVLVLCVY